jgi:predicted dehydrogenase
MNVGIVGCGLIGKKRAATLAGTRLVACADISPERALALADSFPGTMVEHDWRKIIERGDVDIVIVSTPHDSLAGITLEAVKAKKHVLVEKPAGRFPAELDEAIEAAAKTGVKVRVGFNHRYHRAFRKAKEIVDSGALGELMFLRARYGHGGRLGYDKEWRARPEISGGGELIDQGMHLIDLGRWFLGDFTGVGGFAHTYFWNMPVDDNAFLLLRTDENKAAFLHASCTEWKNLFSFEIYGKTGKLHIDGLGGSYGVERLSFYKMLPEMGPPETFAWEFPMADDSWAVEFAEFLQDIREGRESSPGLSDAKAALEIVDKIYKGSGYDHNP